MFQKNIESRRAFMKKFGKLAGAAAFAAPFMAMTAKDAGAVTETEQPQKDGCEDCGYSCSYSCRLTSWGTCDTCKGACIGSCHDFCRSSCQNTAKKD
ncbi:MAG: hypothetical protein IJG38_07265 [Thermoguttaceae bacterium]|nr:hypothetical protein [Thermoguttaceae bacterium]